MTNQNELLIRQCREGNRKAQMQVYKLYCDAMYAICCRYLNDEYAKDAMQEGFLKAFTNIHKYVETFTFGAWLKRIIINLCIDELKKKKLRIVSTDEIELNAIEEESWLFEDSITKEQILYAIDKLDYKYKFVTKLYLLEGYDHTEISEILEITVSTSKTRLRRAKLTLQKSLLDYEKRYLENYLKRKNLLKNFLKIMKKNFWLN